MKKMYSLFICFLMLFSLIPVVYANGHHCPCPPPEEPEEPEPVETRPKNEPPQLKTDVYFIRGSATHYYINGSWIKNEPVIYSNQSDEPMTFYLDLGDLHRVFVVKPHRCLKVYLPE